MSTCDNQPWRADVEAEEQLAADISAQWRALLAESKLCVERLRAVAGDADRRLERGAKLTTSRPHRDSADAVHAHHRILHRLDEFEKRIVALEQRMPEAPPPTVAPIQPPRNHAA